MSDYLIRRAKEREEAFSRLGEYLGQIKEMVRSKDQSAEVFLFGSVARGNFKPDSDIDVLVISDVLGADLKSKVETIEEVMESIKNSIFEIHVISRAEYENWYKKFIDVMIKV
ncbi:nucleotidyltransferase domain-containing protein [Metallosphaera hakonensis]|uniref:DNA polymerase subunit beta n=1 Tax=Metallosphaera hakonensis JCM 8857 = DSM 7519 TaxID=1293036 RepID=A0A2U9IR70_9CREN|nr:nucleotidyltransferase domain-containing protein [Metallosphaera hakonensis]AWR98541.1 DNA polymerase subunit beta [Metallosphaera hakonensis JCM 8857 = DSM 7519]